MKGGNAIDAAVAVGTTLNMMEPQMNGIGGNGFMTIFDKKTGKVYSLSMAGAAPMALKGRDMTPETLNWGMNAGIVPGNFGGYVTALQRFGTMSLAEVPPRRSTTPRTAIRSMFRWRRRLPGRKRSLSEFPTTAKIFLPDGQPPKAGELLKNPDLAATLRKAGRSRASSAEEQRIARRRRFRRRSIGSTRATSRRSSTASSRRTTAY